MIDVQFSQLVTRSPAAFPTGTRPVAIPPITVPSANGVSIDDRPNAAPIRARSRRVALWLLRAYAVPRTMIPMLAANSGTTRVDATEPNAVGYPVHATTSTKISQTWFASQTGAIA